MLEGVFFFFTYFRPKITVPVRVGLIVSQNSGLEILGDVGQAFEGAKQSLPACRAPGGVAQLKFCPAVGMDVERSSSRFKNILSDSCQGSKK